MTSMIDDLDRPLGVNLLTTLSSPSRYWANFSNRFIAFSSATLPAKTSTRNAPLVSILVVSWSAVAEATLTTCAEKKRSPTASLEASSGRDLMVLVPSGRATMRLPA